MRGLVAYEDDSLSDHEDRNAAPSNDGASKSDGSQLNTLSAAASDQPQRSATTSSFSSSSSSKPAIIIRRHAPAKPHLRTRVADDIVDEAGPSTPPPAREASQEYRTTSPQPSCDHGSSVELTRLRQLLRPPPMPGVDAWGIPSEPDTPCDETIKAKITSFLALKRDPHNPRHFNDSLMSNRAFRNPHLYAKLVEFVDVDERTTNFPKRVWDPMDVKEEWFADQIADAQKVRSEATAATQSSSGKRSHIEFAAAHMTASSSAQQLRQSTSEGKPARYQPYNVPPRGGSAQKSSGERVLGGGRGKSRWG